MAAGAAAYLLKPVRKAALLATIPARSKRWLHRRLPAPRDEPDVPIRQRYQQIADRFEEAVRANLATLDRVADLCQAIAVSQRTLLRAVRFIHGTTPFRFAQSLRLAEARKALLSATPRPKRSRPWRCASDSAKSAGSRRIIERRSRKPLGDHGPQLRCLAALSMTLGAAGH